MFSNFFKSAFRILIKYKSYTLINIFGLAIGIACSIIIFLYVHNESSYDKFHKNINHLYRIGIKGNVADNKFNIAVTPAPLAEKLVHEIPDVENAVRIARFGSWLVRYKNFRYNEDNLIFADSTFFQLFSFKLTEGNPVDVLRYPKSIVLSRKAAHRYFGQDNPLGKYLNIENDSTYYKVTGIMENIPVNSHIHFDMVASMSTFQREMHSESWVTNYLYTYILTKGNVSPVKVDREINQLVKKYVLPDYKKLVNINNGQAFGPNDSYNYIIQPVNKIHLRSNFEAEFEPTGNILYVYLFSFLAFVILILSCINFVNLSTARVAERAKEVSIRKINGSGITQLVRQFLTESSLIAILAMTLALLITELFLPPFNHFIGLNLSLGQLLNSSGVILMVVLIIFIGVLSGLYPAFRLSSIKPAEVLRQKMQFLTKRSYFRIGLSAFQFFLSIGIITIFFIILAQYHYLTNRDLGFNKENLLVIRRPDGLKNNLQSYMNKIAQYPGVVAVTNSTAIPGSNVSKFPFYLKGKKASQNYSLGYNLINPQFTKTFEINMYSGRFFDSHKKEDTAACVINEAVARMMGLNTPVGNILIPLLGNPDKKISFKIIGVIRDFNYETLENPIKPLVLILMPGNYEGYLTVRLKPGNQNQTIEYLKAEWESFTSVYPFVSFYLKDNLRDHYNQVLEMVKIFAILSVISVLLACLGIFGLVTYRSGQLVHEFGIKKSLGAGTNLIVLHEIKTTVVQIAIASLTAWPGVYFLSESWLNDYHYRIFLNPLFFLASTFIVIAISLGIVFNRMYASAKMNWGFVLKSE